MKHIASRLRPGTHTENHKPSCTPWQAAKFYAVGRQQKRASLRAEHFLALTGKEKHPHENRADRRKMARAFATGEWRKVTSVVGFMP